MNYEPAQLDEETVFKLREFEQQMSEAAGETVVLIAYTDQETSR
ncbi:hypothetical protein J23TS9_07100 [Paenibacillus sp. J23TS9]|nr:hypothetical protein [Paenibacillus sp. J23TS9]GIP25580.1 hypothetical protein J23TS9_07100 [Paenibacillus sp. J23TS9]